MAVEYLLCRYMMISASEGTQPFNRLWYVDLSQLPKANGALDLAVYDFHKVRLASAWYLLRTVTRVSNRLTPHRPLRLSSVLHHICIQAWVQLPNMLFHRGTRTLPTAMLPAAVST